MLNLWFSTAAAATLTVGSSGDHTSIQDAIDAASDGDLIQVEAGAWEERLRVTSDLVIEGVAGSANTTLSGDETLVTVSQSTVTLRGFTLLPTGERGLSSSGSTLALEDLVVRGTRGGLNGAGVYVFEGSLSMDGVSMEDNHAGGANGGHLAASNATITAIRSSFVGGSAQRGGAMFLLNSDVSLTDCDLSSNAAVEDSEMPRGGAVRAEQGTFSATRTTFVANEVLGGFGGALSLNAVDATVSSSTFDSNRVTEQPGGAVAAWDSALLIRDSTLLDNRADTASGLTHGGAVYVTGEAAQSLELVDSRFEGNQAADYGGAVMVSEGTSVFSGLTLLDNQASSGGGVYISSTERAELSDSTLSGNQGGNGAGLRWRPVSPSAELVVRDSLFEGNIGSAYGGGFYGYSAGSLELTGTRFLSNQATLGGGAMVFDVSNVEVRNNLFCDNLAQGDAQSHGGGLLSYESGSGALDITNNVFTGNHAEQRGGGLMLWSGSEADVVNNNFLGNQADARGAAVYFQGNDARFMNNLVAYSGPGYAMQGSSSPTVATRFTDLWDNDDDMDTALAASTGNGMLELDPLLTLYTGDCSSDSYILQTNSPLIDAGSPSLTDADGTRSDIGATGGPLADARLYTDADGDGWVALSDCDDSNPDVFPGATELPYDGIDQDCDGSDLDDLDEDGWAGTQAGGADCDDDDGSVNPGQSEIWYDGVDQDCDGNDDDQDADGYPYGEDCDDQNTAVFPGAPETPNDGVDSDCDGEDGAGQGDDTGTPLDDTGVVGDDTGGPGGDKDCGCSSASPSGAAGLAWIAVLALIRRRGRS